MSMTEESTRVASANRALIDRRGFFAGLGASLIAAPAIVRAASLMPVKVFKPDVLMEPYFVLCRPTPDQWWVYDAKLRLWTQLYAPLFKGEIGEWQGITLELSERSQLPFAA